MTTHETNTAASYSVDAGALVLGRSAIDWLSPEELIEVLTRHRGGDWGEIDEEERQLNQRARQCLEPVHSRYRLEHGEVVFLQTWPGDFCTYVFARSDHLTGSFGPCPMTSPERPCLFRLPDTHRGVLGTVIIGRECSAPEDLVSALTSVREAALGAPRHYVDDLPQNANWRSAGGGNDNSVRPKRSSTRMPGNAPFRCVMWTPPSYISRGTMVSDECLSPVHGYRPTGMNGWARMSYRDLEQYLLDERADLLHSTQPPDGHIYWSVRRLMLLDELGDG
jgi:hypothetical protein